MGFSEAAIYRHFSSKHDILCAVLDRFIKSLTVSTNEIINTKANSIYKIEKIFTQLSKLFMTRPAYVSVIFAEEIFKNNKSLSLKVGKILEINNDTFLTIIKEGQKKNEIIDNIDSQDLTLMVMGAYRLMVKHWKMDDFSFNLIKKSNTLIKSIETVIVKKI
jgi:AcrR family transcriptional regulator